MFNKGFYLSFSFFILFYLFPYIAYADTYQDAAGTSQMLADNISLFWKFLFDDTPTLWHRFWSWAVKWYVKAKLFAYLEALKFSWIVGKEIIIDLNIMSQITAQISALPQDVRQAFVDMRLFDGLNLLLNAYMTRFVMRTIF